MNIGVVFHAQGFNGGATRCGLPYGAPKLTLHEDRVTCDKCRDSRCANCGHAYQFHQEHWPACKGFTPVTK